MRLLFAPLMFCALVACAHTPSGTSPVVSKPEPAVVVYGLCEGIKAGIDGLSYAQQNHISPLKPERVDQIAMAASSCRDPNLLTSLSDPALMIAVLTDLKGTLPTAAVLSDATNAIPQQSRAVMIARFTGIAAGLAVKLGNVALFPPTAPEAKAALSQQMAADMEQAIANWSTVRPAS